MSTMATELFPILLTQDLERALAFYRDQLGGTVSYQFRGPDDTVVYAGIDIGASQIGIGLDAAATDPPLPRPISLWVYVDDCDAMVERLRAVGTTVREEPIDQPWGERVARVLDPDGNEVIIGARRREGG